MKKVYYLINAIIIIFGLFILTLNLIGYKTYRVISDSMAPDIRKNDLAIVKKYNKGDELEINDIIAFKKNDKLVLHEIVSIEGNSITTKGRNNEYNDDTITYNNVIGVYVFHIPLIGILFISIYPWVIIILALIAYTLISYLIKEIKKSSGGN